MQTFPSNACSFVDFAELALDLGSGHLGKTLRSEKSLEPTVQINPEQTD